MFLAGATALVGFWVTLVRGHEVHGAGGAAPTVVSTGAPSRPSETAPQVIGDQGAPPRVSGPVIVDSPNR